MSGRDGSSAGELIAALRLRGHRLTPQRRAILEELAGARGHIAADAVHRAVAARFPEVNRSTIYRTLDLLERLGYLAHHHDATGIVYHHAEAHRHVHLSCLGCGQVGAIEDPSIPERFAEALERAQGFRVNLTHSTIFGICRGCAAVGRSPAEPHRHALSPDG